MRKILFLAIIILGISASAMADKIYLKNGTIITGQIESKDRNAVVINVKGVPRRYFMQQIDSIDESSQEAAITDYSLENLKSLSEIPQDKVDLILRFLEVDGTKQRMKENLKTAIANAPEDKQPQLKAMIRVDEILTELVPVYDKLFEKDELEEIILFYQSFAGKKLQEVAPIVLNETVKVTYEYVREKFKNSQKATGN